jgi:hypothetical protein
MATIEDVLRDPSTSVWMKSALNQALKRDPVDACHDAELLAKLLRARVDTMLRAVNQIHR